MTAWVNGILGIASSFWVGMTFFRFSSSEVLVCIGASVLSGLTAIFSILTGEKNFRLKKYVLYRPLSTWAVFLSIYFGGLLVLGPPLRNVVVYAGMTIPMILCSGFSILIFGPIQDRIVARSRKR